MIPVNNVVSPPAATGDMVAIVGSNDRRRRRIRYILISVSLLMLLVTGMAVLAAMLTSQRDYNRPRTTPGDLENSENMDNSNQTTITTSTVGLVLSTNMIPTAADDPGESRTCVPVNQTRPVCSLLPYDYTTDGANYTAHNDIMPFYFDPDAKRCHADWFFFLCAYIMPECRPDPPQDWKPLCVCAEFNDTIFGHWKCSSVELGSTSGIDPSRLSCAGREDPHSADCLKPKSPV